MKFLADLIEISGFYFYCLFIVSFFMWSFIFYIFLSLKFGSFNLKSACIKKLFLTRLKTVFFLAGIAPLIGLLGTVDGIMEIFKGIYVSKDVSAKVMASGIGRALTTTQAGLFIAIPGLAAANFIKERYLGLGRLNLKKEEKMGYRTKSKNIVNDLNITPLLDMVFILLIFFVVTSSFMENYAIDLSLPGASTGEGIKKEVNYIVLNKNNEIFLNNEKISYEEISLKFDNLSRKDFVVAADKNVSAGKLIELIDFLRKNNISNISVSVENEE